MWTVSKLISCIKYRQTVNGNKWKTSAIFVFVSPIIFGAKLSRKVQKTCKSIWKWEYKSNILLFQTKYERLRQFHFKQKLSLYRRQTKPFVYHKPWTEFNDNLFCCMQMSRAIVFAFSLFRMRKNLRRISHHFYLIRKNSFLN